MEENENPVKITQMDEMKQHKVKGNKLNLPDPKDFPKLYSKSQVIELMKKACQEQIEIIIAYSRNKDIRTAPEPDYEKLLSE